MKIGQHVVSLAALLAGAGFLWGAWASVMDDDAEASELASLRSAPVCDRQPTEPAACTWDGEFEFVGSERHDETLGDVWYSIDLRDVKPDEDGSPGFVRTVEFSDDIDGDDVGGLTYRAPIEATLWRGRIIEVRIDRRPLPTREYPQGAPETAIHLGISMATGGLVLVVAALWQLVIWRRRPSIAQRVAVRTGIGLPIVGLLVSPFASEVSDQTTRDIGVRQIVLFVAAFTVAGGGLAYLQVRRVRAAARTEVVGD